MPPSFFSFFFSPPTKSSLRLLVLLLLLFIPQKIYFKKSPFVFVLIAHSQSPEQKISVKSAAPGSAQAPLRYKPSFCTLFFFSFSPSLSLSLFLFFFLFFFFPLLFCLARQPKAVLPATNTKLVLSTRFSEPSSSVGGWRWEQWR